MFFFLDTFYAQNYKTIHGSFYTEEAIMIGSWLEDPLVKETLSNISVDRMWELVTYFAALNRDSGKSDEHRACQYVADQLRSEGIPVEVYEFDAYLSHPVSASLVVFSPIHHQFHVLTHSFSGNTPPNGVIGEIAFIGSPEFDPGMQMDARLFESPDLKGRIVLSDGLVRPWKTRIAEEKGACALINVNATDQLHNMIVSTVWGTPGMDEMSKIPSIPVISMRKQDGQKLIRMCREGPVKAAVRAETDIGWFPVLLPVARVEGRNPERFVMIHGHIDSWHVGVTDNATGNATKLELARVLHKHRDRLDHSVVLAWWPGHSTGRYAGSTWFSDRFWQKIFDGAIVDINIDSTGVRNARHAAPKQTYELNAFVETLVDRFLSQDPDAKGNTLLPLGRQGRHADQSFWSNCGSNIRLDFLIPAEHPDNAKVGGSGGGIWWHTEHDTLDKADRNNLGRDTRLNALVAIALINSAVFPFDHRPVASAIESRLYHLQKQSQGAYDFSHSIRNAKAFGRTCNAFLQEVGAARNSKDTQKQASINNKMLQLNRILTPVLLTAVGSFRHQSAEPAEDLPGLSIAECLAESDPVSNAARFIKAQLLREENRLAHALRLAADVIKSKE
jgi:hypothetical protein